MQKNPNREIDADELRRRAEVRLLKRQVKAGGEPKSEADVRRLLHELQVHQIELQMQNAELLNARNESEELLEKFSDLYDFAPVGYFSLDERGQILEVNLTGAALLGVDRSQLVKRCVLHFVAPESRPVFLPFLKQLFAKPGKQVCEVTL